MITMTNGDRHVTLDWVYTTNDPSFKECRWWIVVFSKDNYTIYGLGFNPFDIEWELANNDDWPWPTNDRFHGVSSNLCMEESKSWKIVEVK